MSDYRLQETGRLALAAIVATLGGLLSGQWLLSALLSLLGYLAWLWWQLWRLGRWLDDGADSAKVPEVGGAFENLIYRIQHLQRKSAARKARLHALVERLQRIIAKLPYATVVLDNNNHIQWFNQHAIATLGLNPETDPGQRLDNLLRLPEFRDFLNQASDNPTKDQEITLKNPFGQQAHLAIQLIPVEDDLRLLIARDISDQVRVQRMRRNFIANASHELRSPLTVISGYLEMLLDDPDIPSDTRGMLQAAASQSQRMQSLVEDLLTISRLENSSIEASDMQPVAMAERIREIIANCQKTNPEKHPVTIGLDDDIWLKGNETEIISVINNLITNAMRHTPAQTPIHIQWRASASGETVFSVRDHGPGIAAEHLPHLTERFYRVDKGRSKKTGGTGLGLAIVQHVVKRHRARLDIDSTPGQGTEFRVTFPSDLHYPAPRIDINNS